MNDLGWSLGWLALQVTIVLIPAFGLNVLASRRSPAAGAWVATLGLGMVLLLGVSSLVPGSNSTVGLVVVPTPRGEAGRRPETPKVEPLEVARFADQARLSEGRGWPLARFRLAWDRLERRASGPVGRVRSWGKAFAIASLAGSGLGLVRLLIGLWAVALCRWRGRVVDDPAMVGLVEELRAAMGCSSAVELREVVDLTTPATAGWFRPMLLLPGDWRSWDEAERRAVVAHELAHVVRGDYASGLTARVAVVFQYYHPLVRGMAARLHLEQELAADSLGARFAGGRSTYLLALSRLALKQDGRPSNGPARAFLPARGTLIRRIAMLKDQDGSMRDGVAGSRPARLAISLGLMALTLGVASWKAPARAADDPTPPARPASAKAMDREQSRPFEVRYVQDKTVGAYAFRPSASLKRSGMTSSSPTIRRQVDLFRAKLAEWTKVDPSRPGFVKMGIEDIDSVTVGFNLAYSKTPEKPAKAAQSPQSKPMHMMNISGCTIRTIAPFDWMAFFRQWNMETVELKQPRGVYYKVKLTLMGDPTVDSYFFRPDDRTIVFDEEGWIKELIAREIASSPAYLRGTDWERAGRDLFAVIINNREDAFTKDYDLGRPDDARVVGLFQGVDRWVVGLADADTLRPHAEATARDSQAAEKLEGAVAVLMNMGRMAVKAAPGEATELELAAKLAKGLLSSLQIHREGNRVDVSAGTFGTFVELAELLRSSIDGGMKVRAARDEPKAIETKATPNVEKR